jgi:hypothetical protein
MVTWLKSEESKKNIRAKRFSAAVRKEQAKGEATAVPGRIQ